MPLVRTLFFWGLATYAMGGDLQASETIVVIGDASAPSVLAELRREGLVTTADKAAINRAKLVVVAQDAGDGLMPVHRELLKELSRTGRRNILWIITTSQKVDDWELLELEQMEARELIAAHGLPDDAATFAVDRPSGSTPPKGTWLAGWKAIGEFAAAKVK